MVKPAVKIIAKILFSHVGFCIMIIGYAVGGAFLMRHIELPTERQHYNESKLLAHLVDDYRTSMTRQIIAFCNNYSHENSTEAVREIQAMLTKYHETVMYARNTTITYGRQAYRGMNNYNEIYGWSIPSSILFTATILSTVGKSLEMVP